MTLIAHAIAAAPPAPVADGGLRGRSLTWTEVSGLGVWSSRWDSAVKLERADALEHHRVVERICLAQPCLPVRFGTVFASEDAARASLEPRAAALHTALGRVAGKRELALTLLWRDPAGPAPPPITAGGPGHRYLQERRSRHRAADDRRSRAAALVERLVAELAVDRALVWHATCTSAGVAVSLAVLVPSESALEERTRLERISAALPDVVAVVNGPWPPYTFAGPG